MSTEAENKLNPDQSYPANPLGEITLRRAKMVRRPANFKWKDEAGYWRGNARFWRIASIVEAVVIASLVCYMISKV